MDRLHERADRCPAGIYAIGRYALPRADGERRARSRLQSGAIDLQENVARFPQAMRQLPSPTASVLKRHLGYYGAVPTYLIAAYVGASRLHDNRHFVSDVVFGAAVGIASGWTVVGRHGRSEYTLMPVPTRGGMMMMVTRAGRSQ